MQSFRSCALWAALLAPAALLAQDITVEGTVGIAAGGALLDGDRPAFQRMYQFKKDGWGGIEEFRLVREDKDSVLKFNARALLGEDDYKLGLRYERGENFYFDAGFEQFRVYYDGSGAWFRPTDASFVVFNEDLSLTRSKLWAELGVATENGTLFKLRYERRDRNGTKDSTYWGDTALTGGLGNRNVVPTFYDLDEVANIFTLDVGNATQENVKWNVGARYAENEQNNARFTHRRPTEPNAERILTTRDNNSNDLFAVHGYYLRQVNEKFTVSAGALRTKLDTTLSGTRIYGQTYDPVFDPAAVRRQPYDEGYFDLHGSGQLKQTVLNLNAVYQPTKHVSVRPSIRFENLHQDTLSDFIETVVRAPALNTLEEELEGEHSKKWDEFSEELEVRYTGRPNLTLSAKATWVQGSGDLEETLLDHHTNEYAIERKVDNERFSQKYAFSANWYVKPGLTFAAQYYIKANQNDYNTGLDSTLGTSDRYPSYLANQDFEVNDFNLRMSWRPASMLSLVTRYDNQQAKILTGAEGLAMVQSSKLNSHIISQSATWSPTGRVYLTGNVNVTYDQMETPAYPFSQHGDNNYVNGSLGGGYAVSKLDDMYLDYSWFSASNFIDNSLRSVPYGVSQKFQSASLTWVRRQSEHLVYTFKYGYLTNRDQSWELNDFDAHVFYAKVQYHF